MLEDEKKKNDPNSEIPERPDYEKELEAIIKSNLSDDEIREKLSDYHENDIADVLEDLTEEERQKLYRILGVESVSEIFAYLEDEVSGCLIPAM